MARRIRNGEHNSAFAQIGHAGFALFEDSDDRPYTTRRAGAEGGDGRTRRSGAEGR